MKTEECNYHVHRTCGNGQVESDECEFDTVEQCSHSSTEPIIPRRPMESRPTNCPECPEHGTLGWIHTEKVESTPSPISYPKRSIELGSSLDEAKKIITGERQDSYGNPEDSFTLIARYWEAYLRQKTGMVFDLTSLDTAHMMTLFKIARMQGQSPKRDNYIDAQGYLAIAADRLLP